MSRVRCVSVAGHQLISGSDDRSAKLWSLSYNEDMVTPMVTPNTVTMSGHHWPVTAVNIATSCQLAMTADCSTVKLWQLGPVPVLLANIEDVINPMDLFIGKYD